LEREDILSHSSRLQEGITILNQKAVMVIPLEYWSRILHKSYLKLLKINFKQAIQGGQTLLSLFQDNGEKVISLGPVRISLSFRSKLLKAGCERTDATRGLDLKFCSESLSLKR
jgi:hypothetical protein